MSLKTWLRGMWGETMEPALSPDEAVLRVKQYAETNGLTFRDPSDIRLARRPAEEGEPDSAMRLVWRMGLGTSRPTAFVEVDAMDGAVVAWRQGSR